MEPFEPCARASVALVLMMLAACGDDEPGRAGEGGAGEGRAGEGGAGEGGASASTSSSSSGMPQSSASTSSGTFFCEDGTTYCDFATESLAGCGQPAPPPELCDHVDTCLSHYYRDDLGCSFYACITSTDCDSSPDCNTNTDILGREPSATGAVFRDTCLATLCDDTDGVQAACELTAREVADDILQNLLPCFEVPCEERQECQLDVFRAIPGCAGLI